MSRPRALYSLVLPIEPAKARAFAAGLAAVDAAMREEARTGEANEPATSREVDRTIDHMHELIDATLGQYGLEAHGERTDDEFFRLAETAKGHQLVVHAVAWKVDGLAYAVLPDGAHLDPTGDTLPDPADEPRTVEADDLPRAAQALVTAWWHEVETAGRVPRPVVEWTDLDSQAHHPGGFVFYGRGELPLEVALEYADRLEATARDLRAAVEQKRADAGTRDAEYADAIGTLADRDIQQPGYAAMCTAAELIESGRARIGRAGETWCLTDAPPEE